MESVWDRVVAGAVLGSERFVTQVRERCAELSPEAARGRQLAGAINWEALVRAVEAVHGGRWAEFKNTYGDWGRDLALYLGRMHGRLRLAELGQRAGGIGYSAVAKAVSRARRLVGQDAQWRGHKEAIEAKMSIFKM